jgi:uncharacterized protein YcaQ
VRGTWYVHRDLLEPGRAIRGRTTLLSPFDPLLYDRTRAQSLWSFPYKLEIYVPAAKREFGYFVLPILHRDRLVGRIDPLFDRKAGVLRVREVYAEEGSHKTPTMSELLSNLHLQHTRVMGSNRRPPGCDKG